MRRTKSSISRRRHGVFLALCIIVLSSLPEPTAAIGGWFGAALIRFRMNAKKNSDGGDAGKSQIAPGVPSGGGDSEQEGSGSPRNPGSSKQPHVGEATEVTMTSSSSSSAPTSSPKNEKRDSCHDGDLRPAFVPRARRGGMLNLDENDLRTITFVGNSNPFL